MTPLTLQIMKKAMICMLLLMPLTVWAAKSDACKLAKSVPGTSHPLFHSKMGIH